MAARALRPAPGPAPPDAVKVFAASVGDAMSETFSVTRAGDEPPLVHRILMDGPLQEEFAAAAGAKAAAFADLRPRA